MKAAEDATASNTRFEECRAKLKAAQSLGLLYDLQWEGGGQEPYVVIGSTFYSVPFETKQRFADTVNCFLMVGKGGALSFDLLDWRTNQPVARYRYARVEMVQ